MTTVKSRTAEHLGLLDVLTLIFSVYVLVALLIQVAVRPLSPETVEILRWMDWLVCAVFLSDVFVRFHRAPSKAQFLRWGWIDFVSSLPVNIFQVGRVVRIIRVFRILRAFRSVKNLLTFFFAHKKFTLFAAVVASSLCVMVFSAIAVLNVEDSPEANIKGTGDAFWWAFVTMTTVGYGDKYPVTTEGRIIACVLMTAGAGLFATLTGLIASMFLQSKGNESELKELTQDVRTLAQKIESISSIGVNLSDAWRNSRN